MNSLWNVSHLELHSQPSTLGINFVHRGAGPPVLMIHGLAASLHDWDDLLPAVSATGFSVYAFDLLGHGESAKPKSMAAYTAENAFQHWVQWWEKEAPAQKTILVGHSLGGYMALEYALRFPERVSKLVLINPFYSLSQIPLPLRQILRYPIHNTYLIERTPYWLFRLLIDLTNLRWDHKGVSHTIPERVRVQTAQDYKRAAPGIYNLPRTIRDLTPDLLQRIHVPTLVLWGARDQTLIPRSFDALTRQIPQAKGIAFPHCGHVVHQCHAQQVNDKILEFLNSST